MKRKYFLVIVFMFLAFIPAKVFASSLIPVETFFEDAGGEVEGNSASIHILLDGIEIVLYPGQRTALVGELTIQLTRGVVVQGGRNYLTREDLMMVIEAFYEVLGRPLTTFELTSAARTLALQDFDFLVDLIAENTPWPGVIQRSLGVNYSEHARTLRRIIANMTPQTFPLLPDMFPFREETDPRSLAANYLSYLLAYDFASAFEGIGHLGPRSLEIYRMQLTSFTRHQYINDYFFIDDPHLNLYVDAFTHPSAVWFYGPYEVDLESVESPFPEVEDNIETEILIPGEVAYLRIGSFLTSPENDDLIIYPFLRQIRNYDHLIIDIRGNAGGVSSYFNEIILRRLINEPIQVSEFEFFSGGEVATLWMNAMVEAALQSEIAFEGYEMIYINVTSAADFVNERGMNQFNRNDLANLQYVVSTGTIISPAADSVNFTGRIWLLIDEDSASASSNAAAISLYTGFATVVGENTSGVMGSTHAYTVLPNTGLIWRMDLGYVTDEYGRSLEVYGITPRIRNRRNLDALQTVLMLITQVKQ
jgi:hypothetical protein